MLKRITSQLFILILLAACAPTSNVSVETSGQQSAQPAKVLSNQQLREELARLPGAQVSADEPLVVSYPGNTLFADAALLPMPGGSGSLDALATTLRQSGLNWQLKVRASSGEGPDYDQLLAAERVRVLNTYLREVGIDLKKISMVPLAEAGAPLELTLIK